MIPTNRTSKASIYPIMYSGTKKSLAVPTKVYVLEDVAEDVLTALDNHGLNVDIVDSSAAIRLAESSTGCLFILNEFFNEEYNRISATKNGILGPTATLELISNNHPILLRKNPVYSLSMDGYNCFISSREKEKVIHLMKLIRSMGGSVRAKLNEMEYFIAENTLAKGYLYSSTYNIPTMTPEWISYMWENRNTSGFKCDQNSMKLFTIKTFSGLKIAFLHFPPEENSHIELLQQNQGTLVEMGDSSCTHVVVDDFSLSEQTILKDRESSNAKFVHAEWFWTCIKLESRVGEDDFSFTHGAASSNPGTSKTKVLKSRNSSSWGEITVDPSLHYSFQVLDGCEAQQKYHRKDAEQRDKILEELLATEQNYIDVLEAISKIKEQAENVNQIGGPMINNTESKLIFMNIQELITLHSKIIAGMKISSDGINAFSVFTKYKEEIKSQYTKYCTSFEEAKMFLNNLSHLKPRFRALLEISKNKPENSRQSLQELMHRPLQRLCSVTLLMKEFLLKLENESERKTIEENLNTVEEALRLANEELLQTEKLTSVFRVYAAIDNCPVTLVSSHRYLRLTVFCQDITGRSSMKGDYIAIHLFSDMLEVSQLKKRTVTALVEGKEEDASRSVLYNHRHLLPLNRVKQVVDVTESTDIKNSFALVVRETLVKDTVWSFRYIHDKEKKFSKKELVIFIAKNLARYECSGDFSRYWISLTAPECDGELKTSNVAYKSGMKKFFTPKRTPKQK